MYSSHENAIKKKKTKPKKLQYKRKKSRTSLNTDKTMQKKNSE